MTEGKQQKILVIDDDETTREYVSFVLTKQGHFVDAANCGIAALRLCESGGYDTIFTDMIMPGMSSAELIRELRRLNCKAFIVLMSGIDLDNNDSSPRQLQADALLQKPFTAKKLLDVLPTIIDKTLPIVKGTNEPTDLGY